MRISLVALVVLILTTNTASSAPEGVQLGQPIAESGGTAVNPGDVYGTAEFELTTSDGRSAEEQLTDLARVLVTNHFGNNEGSYLLTLELLRGGKPVVQRPIVSVSYQNKRFLFINWSTKLQRGVTFKGKLLDTEAIRQTNNNIEVALRSYYKADSSFDLSIFDVVDEITKSLNIVEQLDAAGLSAGVIGTVRDLISKSLARSSESEDLFRHSMAFAHLGAVSDITRLLTVPIRYSYKENRRERQGQLDLKVRTWSVSSRFRFDPVEGKYINPTPYIYLANTSLVLNDKDTTIFEFLRQHDQEDVRNFIKALLSQVREGDIVVLSRRGNAGKQGFGHVAFFLNFKDQARKRVNLLGGNQRGDTGSTGAVTETDYAVNGADLFVHSYRRVS
jgi:hypothetical protein